MKLVADLHIHSHYSRATSKDLTFPHLARWAQLKGVHVVGTGDIAHPGWLAEMEEQLVPAEEGLYRLRDDLEHSVAQETPRACRAPVRFLLAGEISNIYKQGGKVRKIHHVVFLPHLDAVRRFQQRLETIGNIRADGRPILGLDSRDLLEIVLETDEQGYLIPAHIWTPWFALLGSKSGFDSVEECFGDLAVHIFALETGLSSDPPMNWRVSSLDRYTLVSNSDAHSPGKLAREATLFDTELSYSALHQAMRSGDPEIFLGTVEFFPEEGKYHYDGHRKCGVRWKPAATREHGGRCPVCGKPVTVGVMHRVEELADRPPGVRPPRARPFHSLIPLPEVLAEIHQVGAGSKRIRREYASLLDRLGPELAILMDVPLEEIRQAGGPLLAEAIHRIRTGQVIAQAGYDGEYGVVRLFQEGELDRTFQAGLFHTIQPEAPEAAPRTSDRPTALAEPTGTYVPGPSPTEEPASAPTPPPGESSPAQPVHSWLEQLNPEQREAVLCTDRPLIIVAGPGTGKTRTLTVRIAHLVQDRNVPPEQILAITFTVKAAEEMRERLAGLLEPQVAERITVSTFHALGAHLVREWAQALGLPSDFVILDEQERRELAWAAFPDRPRAQVDRLLDRISRAKAQLRLPDAPGAPSGDEDPEFRADYARYQDALRASRALDFDDLVVYPVHLLENHPPAREAVHDRYRWISVDEYQDVNRAQYRLLRLLTGGGANLCVIGDPDQAIYGFRGADHRFFLHFHRDYPNAHRIQLTQSYRSAQAILDAAQQVIAHNPDRESLRLWSQFTQEVKLEVHPAPTERAEAEYVVHRIEQMVGGTSYFSLDSGRVEGSELVSRSFGDFAVLYRMNALAAPLEEAFARSGIPYQVVRRERTQPESLRPLLALLWLQTAPESQIHWQVLLAHALPDLPGSSRQRLAARLAHTPRDSLHEFPWPPGLRGSGARLAELVRRPDGDTWPVSQQIRQLAAQLFPQGLEETAQQALERLCLRAEPFGHRLRDFLETLALERDTDAYDPRADRVALMSIHAAKGLEFPVVFLVGCEEGVLPYGPDGEAQRIAEERRLFYVALTRAQEAVVLTHARRRRLFGRTVQHPVSRFVEEIEAGLRAVRKGEGGRKPRPEDLQLRLL